eukprot:g30722.t1
MAGTWRVLIESLHDLGSASYRVGDHLKLLGHAVHHVRGSKNSTPTTTRWGRQGDVPTTTDGPSPPRIGEFLSPMDAESLMSVVGPPELPEAWKQGFFFAGYQPYGLQQVNGGPCGVLAVIQAFLLRALHLRGVGSTELLEVDEKLRHEALCDALAEVLFRNVGDNKKAVVLIPSSAGATVLNGAQLRGLQPALFTSYDQLRHHLNQRPYRDLFFNPSGCGVPLMVFGRAYSNVFDGTKRLGSAKDGWLVLQGAPKRPSIGFLSLFEAYACIEVGGRYKGPTCPVWVICAESHYTVLFSADGTVNPQESEKVLDLFYFDQLARQNERIRLTVVKSGNKTMRTPPFSVPEGQGDLITLNEVLFVPQPPHREGAVLRILKLHRHALTRQRRARDFSFGGARHQSDALLGEANIAQPKGSMALKLQRKGAPQGVAMVTVTTGLPSAKGKASPAVPPPVRSVDSPPLAGEDRHASHSSRATGNSRTTGHGRHVADILAPEPDSPPTGGAGVTLPPPPPLSTEVPQSSPQSTQEAKQKSPKKEKNSEAPTAVSEQGDILAELFACGVGILKGVAEMCQKAEEAPAERPVAPARPGGAWGETPAATSYGRPSPPLSTPQPPSSPQLGAQAAPTWAGLTSRVFGTSLQPISEQVPVQATWQPASMQPQPAAPGWPVDLPAASRRSGTALVGLSNSMSMMGSQLMRARRPGQEIDHCRDQRLQIAKGILERPRGGWNSYITP